MCLNYSIFIWRIRFFVFRILVDQHREEKESLVARHSAEMQEAEEKNEAIIGKQLN